MVKIFAKKIHSGIFVFFGFLITLETCLWVRMSSWDVYLMWFGRTSIESVSIWHSEKLIHRVCWSHPLHEVARDNSRPENWWVYIDKLSSHDFPWSMYGVTNGADIVLGHHGLPTAMMVHLNDLRADLHRSVNFSQNFWPSGCDLRSGYDVWASQIGQKERVLKVELECAQDIQKLSC